MRVRKPSLSSLFLKVPVCLLFCLLFLHAADAGAAPSDYYDTIQKCYIGYYQRPADPIGLIYWATRLDANTAPGSSPNLSAIIEAFASSPESLTLYGTINSTTISGVVNGIYRALFDRDAEQVGLNWYVDGFNSGQYTAATIMLNVLYGAHPPAPARRS